MVAWWLLTPLHGGWCALRCAALQYTIFGEVVDGYHVMDAVNDLAGGKELRGSLDPVVSDRRSAPHSCAAQIRGCGMCMRVCSCSWHTVTRCPLGVLPGGPARVHASS